VQRWAGASAGSTRPRFSWGVAESGGRRRNAVPPAVGPVGNRSKWGLHIGTPVDGLPARKLMCARAVGAVRPRGRVFVYPAPNSLQQWASCSATSATGVPMWRPPFDRYPTRVATTGVVQRPTAVLLLRQRARSFGDEAEGAGRAGQTSQCVIRQSSVGAARPRFTAVPSPAIRQRCPAGTWYSGHGSGSNRTCLCRAVVYHCPGRPQSRQTASSPCLGSDQAGIRSPCTTSPTATGSPGSSSWSAEPSRSQHASHTAVRKGTSRTRPPGPLHTAHSVPSETPSVMSDHGRGPCRRHRSGSTKSR
jgi:hypothetical protein